MTKKEDFMNTMTVREAAQYLKISEATLYAEIRSGRLAYYRPNPKGRIYIVKEDLDAYISRGRVEACNV